MNTPQVVSETDEDTAQIRLLEEVQNLIPKPGGRRKALALVACAVARARGQKRRLLEYALSDLLPQYLGLCPDPDTAAVVRQLMADIAARGAE